MFFNVKKSLKIPAEVINSRKSNKNIQYNDQMKKDNGRSTNHYIGSRTTNPLNNP